MKVISGVVHVVKVADAGEFQNAPGDGLEVRTAFRPDNGMKYVNDYINLKGMHQIHP